MMIKERQSYYREFKQKAVELSFARGNAKEIARLKRELRNAKMERNIFELSHETYGSPPGITYRFWASHLHG